MRKMLSTLVLVVPLSMVLQAEPASAGRAKGIDISQYQDVIDWPAVGDTSIRFVIARATRGNNYADPMYDFNKDGAEGEGIHFTAYHYAKPDGGKPDALEEANHFVDNADLHSGNMIPALDLEQTGGLSPRRMAQWAATWLNRVQNRIGVKPMIYTSPSFWKGALDNTRRFAKNGYRLWVAHWFTRNPDVPAQNWSRHGWTFWQWTDCGSVNGIDGCVDKDRYKGENLGKVEI
ncbi:MAG: GH25 family lysozyme [Actinomycetota bacterium]